ncbi:MAG TPA: hypothetical protein VJ574_06095 [Candidatus Bathyarchaeia archaeon]|nr:hypothetical protein [Candidatus Bathyarchaeia archaeon]
MKRANAIRVLRFSIIGLILLTLVFFAASTYTLINGLSGAISGNSFHLQLDKGNSTDDWKITITANPRNTAFLPTRLFVNLGILNSSGAYIAHNSTSVDIAPGGQTPFTMILTIPYAVVQKYGLEQVANVTFEMIFGMRTLWDLVGFTQVLRIEGEVRL